MVLLVFLNKKKKIYPGCSLNSLEDMGIDICNSLVSWKQGKTATVAGKKTLKMAFKLLQEMKQAHATLNPHMKWGVQLTLLSKILGESVK